jgi:hypothetical protein
MQLSEAQNLTINTQEHTNFRKLGGKCRESRAQNEQLSKPKLTNHKRRPWPTQTQGERERERERVSYPTPNNRNPQEFSSTQEDLTHMKSRKTKKQQQIEEEEQERQQRAENTHKNSKPQLF